MIGSGSLEEVAAVQCEVIVEYQLHPSVELRQLFASMRIPPQGQDPEKASVLFVGLDLMCFSRNKRSVWAL